MVGKKTWKEFRDCGMLWWINMILHTFGWAIVVIIKDNGDIIEAYPARVKFRGFDEKSNDEGYIKISEFMEENAKQLADECKE